MQPIKEILELGQWLTEQAQPAAVATVVRTSGSTYRKIGARLAVTADGRTFGAVSAGCLEADVIRAGKAVLDTGVATPLHYDNSAEEDIIWGLGLGCNGVVDILVQPFEALRKLYVLIRQALEDGRSPILSTLIQSGNPDLPVGTALCAVQGELVSLSPETSPIRGILQASSRGRLLVGPRGVFEVPDSTGEIWCVEELEPQSRLVVLGADPDSIPLVRLAGMAGFDVTLVDHRPDHANRDRYPEADRVVVCRPSEITEHVSLDPQTLVVVKTHNYLQDREYLATLLSLPVAYIGPMGPRSRMERLLADLAADGIKPNEEQLSRLHAPVGLDLNAETAEQIAVGIVAELLAVVGRRGGGKLRAQVLDIHPRGA